MQTDPNAETKPLAVAGVPDDGKGGRPGLFLDRDGVLLQTAEGKYTTSRSEARFIPRALEALRELAKLDAWIFVVTNQAGIASGQLTAWDLNEIHEWMVEKIESVGGRIDQIYICPHAKGTCVCRKPEPYLILEAADEWGVDLSRSVMVGDYITDLEVAANAGLGWYVHVDTGRQKGATIVNSDVFERDQYPVALGEVDLLAAVPLIGKIVNERVS